MNYRLQKYFTSTSGPELIENGAFDGCGRNRHDGNMQILKNTFKKIPTKELNSGLCERGSNENQATLNSSSMLLADKLLVPTSYCEHFTK